MNSYFYFQLFFKNTKFIHHHTSPTVPVGGWVGRGSKESREWNNIFHSVEAWKEIIIHWIDGSGFSLLKKRNYSQNQIYFIKTIFFATMGNKILPCILSWILRIVIGRRRVRFPAAVKHWKIQLFGFIHLILAMVILFSTKSYNSI